MTVHLVKVKLVLVFLRSTSHCCLGEGLAACSIVRWIFLDVLVESFSCIVMFVLNFIYTRHSKLLIGLTLLVFYLFIFLFTEKE